MSNEPVVRPRPAPSIGAQRPPEVWIVSILLVFVGGLSTSLGAYLLSQLVANSPPGQSAFGVTLVWNLIAVVASLAHVVSGVFVLLGREWARKLAIGICVFSVLSSLPLLFTGTIIVFLVGVVTYVALIMSLNRYPVTNWTR